jgi:hypothetical protein
MILAPMFRKREHNTNEADNSEGSRRVAGFRAVYVWDRLSRDLRPSLCAPDGIRQRHFRESPR